MKLSFDIYSGRPNPSWSIPDSVASKMFELVADSGLFPHNSPVAFPNRLGYCGMNIVLPQSICVKYNIPPWLNLPREGTGRHLGIIRELTALAEIACFFGVSETLIRIIKLVLQQLGGSAKPPVAPAPIIPTGPCAFEQLAFTTKPWNDPGFVGVNNCYAYACNKPDSSYKDKPQPGIGSGKECAFPPTGPDVEAATIRDGAHAVNDCFPGTEAPRSLVALVIWPGEDYHWYRKQDSGWAHKRGGSPAKNVDESGKAISNPETCDRADYTIFHGYLLIPKSQKVAA